MSGFWNLWIAGLVSLNIAFVGWLLFATALKKKGDQKAGPETTGHIWDGDLREYNNPLPRWWLGIFYASIVFALLYLVLFPGFGSFKGILGWSQVGQWQGQKADADAVVAREFARFTGGEAVLRIWPRIRVRSRSPRTCSRQTAPCATDPTRMAPRASRI